MGFEKSGFQKPLEIMLIVYDAIGSDVWLFMFSLLCITIFVILLYN